jgi:3-hydroxyacyl-[acyl-carrier-protein] dehydratase
MINIKELIPHRDPFLFVDEVLEITENSIKTVKNVSKDEYFFKGHYPTNPVMPGVIMVEAALQSGAIMLSYNLKKNGSLEIKDKFPVVTRINEVKFKNMVKPDNRLTILITTKEVLSNVYFLKAKILNKDNKTALTLDFAVTLA